MNTQKVCTRPHFRFTSVTRLSRDFAFSYHSAFECGSWFNTNVQEKKPKQYGRSYLWLFCSHWSFVRSLKIFRELVVGKIVHLWFLKKMAPPNSTNSESSGFQTVSFSTRTSDPFVRVWCRQNSTCPRTQNFTRKLASEFRRTKCTDLRCVRKRQTHNETFSVVGIVSFATIGPCDHTLAKTLTIQSTFGRTYSPDTRQWTNAAFRQQHTKEKVSGTYQVF